MIDTILAWTGERGGSPLHICEIWGVTEQQQNCFRAANLKTGASDCFPFFSLGIFTGGRSTKDNTGWYNSLVV